MAKMTIRCENAEDKSNSNEESLKMKEHEMRMREKEISKVRLTEECCLSLILILFGR